ncbi:MAG: RNA polymerase sigma factor [bacterium]|nr:RNA polymerase sigma factor [bacterium]
MATSANQKDFEQIVLTYQRDIVNFHYRFTGNRFEAEDLAQETFIKAYKKIHTLKEPEKLKSWLFHIARNSAVDFFRKNRNRAIPVDHDVLASLASMDAPNYEKLVEETNMSKEIKNCVNLLEADEKLLINLLYYHDFSYKQIAKMLNINQNTLKSRLRRARMSLLDIIRNKGLAEEFASLI